MIGHTPANMGEVSSATIIDCLDFEKEEKIDNNRIPVLTGSLIAVGTGVATAIVSATRKPMPKTSFSHLLNRNIPIDQTKLIVAHNAGSTFRDAGVPGGIAQSLTIKEMLDSTPVRGFELDLHKRGSDIIVNHGNAVSPFWGKPLKFSTQLKEILIWLNKKENLHEVVVLEIENYASNYEVSVIISKILGNNAIFYRNGGQAEDFPSINELVQKKKGLL